MKKGEPDGTDNGGAAHGRAFPRPRMTPINVGQDSTVICRFSSIVLFAIIVAGGTLLGSDHSAASLFSGATIQKIDDELAEECQRVVSEAGQARIKKFSRDGVIAGISSDPDFETLFLIRYWIPKHRDEVVDGLIAQISNQTFVGLRNSADVIILERIEHGDLQFYGHGWVVPDDLFTVAGRASWLLKETFGEDFGNVGMKSTPEELAALQKRWQDWLDEKRRR